MARRADHTRDELKDLILKASWKIVGEAGFEGLTARAIAGAVGYAPGTIYNLFDSMDDLYLAVNARTLDALYEALNNPLCNDPSKPLAYNLKAMALAYARFARDERPYWLMLFSHRLPEARKTMPWYQEKIDRLFAPLENLLQPLYSPRQNHKRTIAARALWASIHGLVFLQETGKIPLVEGKAAGIEMSSYLIDAFLKGVESGEH